MEFAQITYTKTVEGNFEVQLIHNNTVIAHITFPTEELAKEYVDIKTKLKADYEAVLAKVKAELSTGIAEAKTAVSKVETDAKAVVADVETDAKAVETKVESVVNSIKARVEKAKPIDVSAKVSGDANKVIDTSAKAAPSPDADWQASAAAKVVVPEQ